MLFLNVNMKRKKKRVKNQCRSCLITKAKDVGEDEKKKKKTSGFPAYLKRVHLEEWLVN